RKPLSDRTNTVSRSSQQSSSSSATILVKFANLNLTSSLKESSLDVYKPEDSDGSDSLSAATTGSPLSRRISSDLGFPAPNQPPHGATQDCIEQQRAYYAEIDAYELLEEEVSEPSGNKVKPLKLAPKKVNSGQCSSLIRSVIDMCCSQSHLYGKRRVKQDYMEQQRAYYAEVDAYEILEEEVSFDCYVD
ncbi:unnamed protein product, partial [Cochlearia groenlandica]